MRYLKKILVIAIKDIRLEARSREQIPAMILFSLIVIVIFSFTFKPGLENREVLAPGILWVAFTFAGMLGLTRSFSSEMEQGAIRGLVMSPVAPSAIYLGKVLSNLVFLIVTEAINLLAFSIFFNIDIFPVLPGLAVIVVLATFGFVVVGTLYTAMMSNIHLRELLLPILFLPILIPVLIAAVNATGGVIQGESLNKLSTWLNMLLAYDIIFLIIGLLTFEYVVEE